MDDKTLRQMIILLISCFALLAALYLIPFGKGVESLEYISIKNVKGIEVVHNSKPYTLNLDQQSKMIHYLNMTVLVKKEVYPPDKNGIDFDKIVIYPFDKPTITLAPVRVEEKGDLVFDAPEWSKDNYFLDLSTGNLKNLITESFSK